MIVKHITRIFTMQIDKASTIELKDINPNFSVEQVLEHYTNIYPQLTTAKIEDKGVVNGKRLIQFTTIAGTKG